MFRIATSSSCARLACLLVIGGIFGVVFPHKAWGREKFRSHILWSLGKQIVFTLPKRWTVIKKDPDWYWRTTVYELTMAPKTQDSLAKSSSPLQIKLDIMQWGHGRASRLEVLPRKAFRTQSGIKGVLINDPEYEKTDARVLLYPDKRVVIVVTAQFPASQRLRLLPMIHDLFRSVVFVSPPKRRLRKIRGNHHQNEGKR